MSRSRPISRSPSPQSCSLSPMRLGTSSPSRTTPFLTVPTYEQQQPLNFNGSTFHITVTLDDGRTVDADVAYTPSQAPTCIHTPIGSYSKPSALLERPVERPAVQPPGELLAAAVSSALHLHEADMMERGQIDNRTPPPSANDSESDIEPLLLPDTTTLQTPPATFAQKVGNGIYTTATTTVAYAIATAAAAPTALNALAAPSGKSPSELGPVWWKAMSPLTRAHAIANGGSSLLINTIMNALFIPIAWQKFRTNIVHIFDSIGQFLDNSFSLILALGGALAAGAIGYNAFLWLPAGNFLALLPAAIAFIVTFAQRYVGVKAIFSRIKNFFDQDAKTQQELADALQHIDKKYLDHIEALFREKLAALLAGKDGTKPLTEKEYEHLLIELSGIVSQMQAVHPDLINNKTTLEYITRYTGILFDMLFAILVIVPPSFLTHMQKGYDSVNIITTLSSGKGLPDMNTLLKCLIGLDPALASAMLYGTSALDIRTTLTDTTKYLYQHPRSIAFAVPLLVANAFASGGMQNVAMGVVNNSNNLFSLKPKTPLSDVFIGTMTAGGGVVNTNASLKKAFLSSKPAAEDMHVADMAKRAGATNEGVISKQTGKALRAQSFFKNKEAAKKKAQEELEHQPTGDFSPVM